MVKSEFKKITKEWFFSKGFIKGADKGFGNHFRYTLEKFDVYVMFDKSPYSEVFEMDIGFHIKSLDWIANNGNVRVEIPNKKYWKHLTMADGSIRVVKTNFYYEEWSKEDYLQVLEEVYKIYIQPYFDGGLEHVKNMLIHTHAHEGQVKLLSMIKQIE